MPESAEAQIKQALLDLLEKRDIRQITMKEIAEHAQVSRGTLYLYYEDKFSIIEDLMGDMQEGLSEALYEAFKHMDTLHLSQKRQTVHPTLSFVHQHQTFFSAMMVRDNVPYHNFHRFFKDVFQQDVMLSPIHVNLTPMEQEIYGHYRALYTYAIILYWLNEDASASPEAISHKVWELVSQKRFYWLFGQAVEAEPEENKQIDRRVVRTRQALQEALLDVLAEKKDYAAVTISDITRKSNIRRATFYDHYANKDELVQAMIHQSCADMIDRLTVSASPDELSLAEAETAFASLLSALSERSPIVRFLNPEWGIPHVIPSMFKALESFYLHQQLDIRAGKKLYAYYVSAMIIGLMLYRLDEGKAHDPRVLAREFLQFLDVKKYKIILL
ncbi:TetR/AcrR family transcriptional regulator [Bacillus mojavensis]|uniref:TetR/AcrR family transcriptional regulator n=1 Tax=Bacillus mojavensis TaxID=72360 RepID=UPI002DBAD9C3|nr:TetR/AcrR family transcriptional regulator [Bacillus mojavensis]MEC1611779.1 TetR/AcrR family transcriptional regulator [Bacillus mojavensis]MEC1683862.1 TetR/AcrR family transcriptional regulator [Bacillus mojavensis]MEC1690815.1 TetR/AcrR family transcriptional regulator [Bacillus mojavensis]MEC1707643.1 TetR/AcrR family transcriptional regulator [Bacillus mojavensis]MEC1732342.1 TetR/AcrR family transcriptional regulator [Bacillus mojavensis]